MSNTYQNSRAAESASKESQNAGNGSTLNRGIDVLIQKIGNKWRVVHGSNNSSAPIRLSKGETGMNEIRLKAVGSDVSIQFPNNNLFGNDIYKLNKTDGPKKLQLKEDALPGDYAFAAFVHKDLVYAVGESPPRIIVM